MNYPASYIAVERKMKLGELTKRFDLLVFDNAAHPWMLIECKSMDETLDSRVLWQVLRYNMAIPVKYIVITNGGECHAFIRGLTDFDGIGALPTYSE
jgi:hypothetical protein